MKKIVLSLLFIGVLGAVLSACTGNTASFATTEEQRKTVRENVSTLVTKFRADNHLEDLEIYQRGDSTIAADCPQGDGWASVDLVNKADRSVAVSLKCSTVSEGIGCMTDKDFKTKRYAQEDGKCNSGIPFPIPKIGGK